MKFNTYEFLCMFLPLVLLGFALLRPWGRRPAVLWLVLASFFFYAWWEPIYLTLLLASMLGNFALGLLQVRTPRGSYRARFLLTLGVVGNLAALAWFKYAGFLLGSFAAITGVSWSLGEIILPLAISFFTFQQLAYQVDCYRRLSEEHSFLDYCLFVSFFPQLVAGPIVHHATILPQVADPQRFRMSAQGLSLGLSFLIFGLAKKILIADALAPHATSVFDASWSGQEVSFLAAWAGVTAFTCQIYFDFSGYSDMAVGLGHLFGIRLPRNFDSPLRASSISDLWKRWHITLSTWLRDYLYIPLGGNRRGTLRTYINLMLVMLLGGLWHGASWNFVIWGGLHGLYLSINHAWRAQSLHFPRLLAAPLGWFLTFVAFVVSMTFFRAPDLASAWGLIRSMLGLNAGLMLFPGSGWGILLFSMLLILAVPNLYQIFADWNPSSDRPLKTSWLRWRPCWYWWLPTALLGLYVLTQVANVSEFLYYNF